MQCWKCGIEIQPVAGVLKVMKHDSCAGCDSDLHVCKNCRFYDPAYHNECREPQAEWVRDKEKANYCDYFEPSSATRSTTKQATSKSDARAALNRLFRD